MEAIITDYSKDQFKTASGKTLTVWRCCHRQASVSQTTNDRESNHMILLLLHKSKEI